MASASLFDQPLLIVGASARAAAGSARRAGFRVAACDLFADRDLALCGSAQRTAHYPRGLETWLAKQPQAPWLYTGALENHPLLVEAMARVRPLWGNAGDALQAARDPDRWCGALERHGLPVIPWERHDADDENAEPDLPAAATRWDETIQAVAGYTEGSSPLRWLHKPYASGGGLGVRYVNEMLKGSPRKAGFRQLEIPGRPCGAVYIAGPNKTLLLGVSRQSVGARWCGAQGFQYAGSLGPLPLEPRLRQRFARLGECLRSELGLRGLFGVDAMVTDDLQVWPVEINPRYTASVEVLEAAMGVPTIAWHAAACQGVDPPSAMPPPRGWAGKAVLYARRNFTLNAETAQWMIDAVWPWELPGHDEPHTLQTGVADLPAAGDNLIAGRPVCTVLACGPSAAAVEQALRRQVRQWEQRFYS